jgi:hypothetical protein
LRSSRLACRRLSNQALVMMHVSSQANQLEIINYSCSVNSDSLSLRFSKQVVRQILKDSNSKDLKMANGKTSGQWIVLFILAGIALTWTHKITKLNNSGSVVRMKRNVQLVRQK